MTQAAGQSASCSDEVTAPDLAWLCDWIARHAGIRLEQSRASSLRAVVLSRMEAGSLTTFADYRRRLENSHAGSELAFLIEPFTIPETSFFRYPQQFEALRDFVIPELLARRTDASPLKVWSAGCATGEEPYTLAMVLRESAAGALGLEGSVLATDLNERYLAHACRGVYEERSLRNLPPVYLSRYLTPAEGGYEVARAVRSMVSFARLNLAADAWLPPDGVPVVDIVFCRNVLIYFDSDAAAGVIERLLGCLKEGGYLFLGHSESLRGLSLRVETVSFEGAWAYRKDSTLDTVEPVGLRGPALPAGLAPAGPSKARLNGGSASRAIPATPPIGVKLPGANGKLAQAPGGGTSIARSLPGAGRASVPQNGRGSPAPLCPGEALGTRQPDGKQARDVGAGGAPGEEAFPLLERARIAADRADYEEAIRLCAASVETEACRTRAYLLLASLCRSQGKHPDAVGVLKQALFLDRGAPELHCQLGEAYRALGETGKALRAFRNALSHLRQRAPTTVVVDTDGITYGTLREMCRAAVKALESEERQGP